MTADSTLRWYLSCDAAWDPATGRAGLAVQTTGVRGGRIVVIPAVFRESVKAVDGSVQAEELSILLARQVAYDLVDAVRITNDCLPAVKRVLAGAPHPVPLVHGVTGWHVHRAAQRAMRAALPTALLPSPELP